MWPILGPRPLKSVVFYCAAIKNSRSEAEAIFLAMWLILGPRPLKSVVFYCAAIKNSFHPISGTKAVASAVPPGLAPPLCGALSHAHKNARPFDNGRGPRRALLGDCRSRCPRKAIRHGAHRCGSTLRGSLAGLLSVRTSSCSSVLLFCFAYYMRFSPLCQAASAAARAVRTNECFLHKSRSGCAPPLFLPSAPLLERLCLSRSAFFSAFFRVLVDTAKRKIPAIWWRVSFVWWAFRDSNPGPIGYEPSALTS